MKEILKNIHKIQQLLVSKSFYKPMVKEIEVKEVLDVPSDQSPKQ